MSDDEDNGTIEADSDEINWPAAFMVVGLAFAFVALMWVWSHPGVCR